MLCIKGRRMEITTEMTKAAYALAVEVYHGRIPRKQAIDQLVRQYGMNSGSASDYLVNFRKMMTGQKYTRTNNSEATDYFLTNILKDYGSEKLGKAVTAVKEHVEYYEGIRKVNLDGIRKIIQKHEQFLNSFPVTLYPDELLGDETLYEGIKKKITVNAYERNQEAREKCVKHYGYKCAVCEFIFENKYGDIGKNFIHVHHLKQISTIGKGYQISPINDLRPVCPNCHAMLHRRNPPYSIYELKKIII